MLLWNQFGFSMKTVYFRLVLKNAKVDPQIYRNYSPEVSAFPGGLEKLREAGRNSFDLTLRKTDLMVPSYESYDL